MDKMYQISSSDCGLMFEYRYQTKYGGFLMSGWIAALISGALMSIQECSTQKSPIKRDRGSPTFLCS